MKFIRHTGSTDSTRPNAKFYCSISRRGHFRYILSLTCRPSIWDDKELILPGHLVQSD